MLFPRVRMYVQEYVESLRLVSLCAVQHCDAVCNQRTNKCSKQLEFQSSLLKPSVQT